jgi:hypothetical protein
MQPGFSGEEGKKEEGQRGREKQQQQQQQQKEACLEGIFLAYALLYRTAQHRRVQYSNLEYGRRIT